MLQEYSLSNVYRLLEPGPVTLLTTQQNGKANVMSMSWHMMMEFTPPLVACVVSAGDHSFTALRETKQCVIAIPGVEMAEQVVKAGNCSGRQRNKFALCGLTPLPAQKVKAPLIEQCFANLECRVVDETLVERYNLFVLEVVQAWTDPAKKSPKTLHHHGYGTFVIDGERLTIDSDMP